MWQAEASIAIMSPPERYSRTPAACPSAVGYPRTRSAHLLPPAPPARGPDAAPPPAQRLTRVHREEHVTERQRPREGNPDRPLRVDEVAAGVDAARSEQLVVDAPRWLIGRAAAAPHSC